QLNWSRLWRFGVACPRCRHENPPRSSLLRLLPFVFDSRAGRMESSLPMGLLPSAGASVEIDTPRMAMLVLASRAIMDPGLWRSDLGGTTPQRSRVMGGFDVRTQAKSSGGHAD